MLCASTTCTQHVTLLRKLDVRLQMQNRKATDKTVVNLRNYSSVVLANQRALTLALCK